MDYEFEKLIRQGEIETVEKTTRLIHAGDNHQSLFFIVEGSMDASFRDQTHIKLEKGEFVGEESFIGKPQRCKSSVDALQGCRFVRWDLQKLKGLMAKHAQAERALEVKVGRQLASKLKMANDRLSRSEHQLLVMRMAFGTGTSEVGKALHLAFEQHDADGDGTITWKEFHEMMRKLDNSEHSVTTAQLRNLFDAVDEDASGEITVDEFLAWLSKE